MLVAAFVVAVGAAARVVKLSTEPKVVPPLLTASILKK